jgi:hypothetical protein
LAEGFFPSRIVIRTFSQKYQRGPTSKIRLDLCSYFHHFLAHSRPCQFFRKKFWNCFDLVSSPILAEFNAPISFCPRPPRLDLCSYFHHFSALSRPHQCLRTKFWNLFGSASSPILAEFNLPISFGPRPPRLDLCSYFLIIFELFPDLTNFWGKHLEIFLA